MADYTTYVSYKTARCRLYISERNREIRVTEVYAGYRNHGHGSELMTLVCEFADDLGMQLILRAHPYGEGEKLDNEQLRKFYEKFGFISTQNFTMIRERYE